MLAVSPSELAAIQAECASVLDKPASIQRKVRVKDGRGSYTETWPTISPPGLMASLALPTPEHLQNYDFLIGAMDSWQVHLPYGTSVQAQDHITIEGLALEVQVIMTPQSYPGLTTVLAAAIR